MKVIIDTNVLISGIFFNGPPYEILQKWQQGKFDLLVSVPILNEYKRVGQLLSKKYPGVNINPVLEFIEKKSNLINITLKIPNICSDPDDDKFFECAVNGNCTLIVSGDRHLLEASGFRNIYVLKPRDFLDKYFRN